VSSSNGAVADLTAHQTAPGAYETSLVAAASETLTVSMAGDDSGATTRFVVPDAESEYRLRPPDEALLRSLATATGGGWQPTPDTLRQIAGAHQVSRRALWPWLVLLALLVWCGDVLLRRVRVFERADSAPSAPPRPA
jgi:Ca-activated chloride channel family protein